MWYPRSPSLLNYLVTGDLFQWPGSSVPSVVILRLHDSNNLGCPLLVKRKSSDSLSASRTMIFTPLIFLTREKNTPHIERSVFLPVCVGDLPAGAPEKKPKTKDYKTQQSCFSLKSSFRELVWAAKISLP